MRPNKNIGDRIIAAAVDSNINENQIRILMFIISKYVNSDSLLQQAIDLPTPQSAEQLNIPLHEYEADINVLQKHALITVHDTPEHIALN